MAMVVIFLLKVELPKTEKKPSFRDDFLWVSQKIWTIKDFNILILESFFGKILNLKVLAFYAIALIFGIPAGAGP